MTFEPAALLIGLREGLEALLILGILLGMLHRLGHAERRRQVWLGALGGAVASVLVGILVQAAFQAWFEDTGAALFEVVVALTAVGILTYMILWMQKHTTQLLDTVKRSVQQAATTGHWGLLAALAFFTVFREGIEVVLFYAARSADVSWTTLILSGLVGFLLSAAIAYAIFRLTVKVSLRAFFGITGGLLVFVAAGLLIHIVHAMADLGWIGHGTPLWDTSNVLPDEDHWLGGPLHALIGYAAQPTALQLMVYLGYVVGVGGWFMASLRPEPTQNRAQWTAMALVIMVLVGFAFVAAAPSSHDEDVAAHGQENNLYAAGLPDYLDHDAITADAVRLIEARLQEDPDFRIGVLVRSHGEPQEYNATTYQSFKAFVQDIWPYTGLPPGLLEVDTGTYYIDDAHPFSQEVHFDGDLVDAWLKPWNLPAAPACDPVGLDEARGLVEGCYYYTPGAGPGFGEGDLYEILGLGTYRTWLKMDNFSPKVQQTEDHFTWMAEHLQKHFGDRVVATYAYSIDPHMDPHRSLPVAINDLVAMQPDLILDSYQSSVFSDAMNTCMMRPHAQHLLREAGFDGPIVDVGMAGTHQAWGEAVASYLAQETDHFSEGESVSVYLAQHGGNPESQNPCGQGSDQYHDNLATQFQLSSEVIEAHFGDRFTLRQVSGQGAGDPDDGTLSPMEALKLDRNAGTDHVVIIPYEFWSDAMDNLVPLRESLGFTSDQAPYYDANYETHVTWNGIHVDVWSAHYGIQEKGTALLARISEAIVEALQ